MKKRTKKPQIANTKETAADAKRRALRRALRARNQTHRELQVHYYQSHGLTAEETAQILKISPRTVEVHSRRGKGKRRARFFRNRRRKGGT